MPVRLLLLLLLAQSGTPVRGRRLLPPRRAFALPARRRSCTTWDCWPDCVIRASCRSASARTTGPAATTTGSTARIPESALRMATRSWRKSTARGSCSGSGSRTPPASSPDCSTASMSMSRSTLMDVIDRPSTSRWNMIFSGTHPHFPRPLVFEGSGGFVSYVPIPFRNGCKILVEGLGVRFYQIDLIKLPTGADVTSFTEQPGPEARAELARAAALWAQPGDYESRELAGADVAHYEVEGLASSTHQYALRAGPATIRSLEIIPAAGTEDAWRAARLRMVWDHDEAANAGVDLPLGLAFGRVEGSGPYQSLLVGRARRRLVQSISDAVSSPGHRTDRHREAAQGNNSGADSSRGRTTTPATSMPSGGSRFRRGPVRISPGSRNKAAGISRASC